MPTSFYYLLPCYLFLHVLNGSQKMGNFLCIQLSFYFVFIENILRHLVQIPLRHLQPWDNILGAFIVGAIIPEEEGVLSILTFFEPKYFFEFRREDSFDWLFLWAFGEFDGLKDFSNCFCPDRIDVVEHEGRKNVVRLFGLKNSEKFFIVVHP